MVISLCQKVRPMLFCLCTKYDAYATYNIQILWATVSREWNQAEVIMSVQRQHKHLSSLLCFLEVQQRWHEIRWKFLMQPRKCAKHNPLFNHNHCFFYIFLYRLNKHDIKPGQMLNQPFTTLSRFFFLGPMEGKSTPFRLSCSNFPAMKTAHYRPLLCS